MRKLSQIIVIYLLSITCVFAQNSKKIEWSVTLNTNLYLPIKNQEKGVYPILWFGKTLGDENKVIVGGFGIVTFIYTPLNEKWKLKYQLNFTRRVFYDEGAIVRDAAAGYVAAIPARAEEYNVGTNIIAKYSLNSNLGVGIGLGTQTLLNSSTLYKVYLGNFNNNEPIKLKNKFYRTNILTLPIEVSYQKNKWLFNLRFEYGLVNRLKNDSQFKDRFGQLFFEVGYKLR